MNRAPLALLLFACFLAPLLGGQVFIGAMPMSEGFVAGLRGAELPITAHAILALIVLVGLIISLTIRRVVQLPNPVVLTSLAAVLFSFGMACGISEFRSVSWFHWVEWVSYGVGLIATVAVVGRDRGPRAVTWAIVAGTGLVAMEGILEYGSMRAIDPTWRIFGGWVNPNALAGMLLIGGLLALGRVVGESDRLAKLAAGSIAVLIGFAIFLSQSRGGLIGFAVGLVALIAFLLGYGAKQRVLALAVPLIVVAVLGLSVQTAPSHSAAPAGISRVGNVSSTAEQSSGYRMLLWRGAVAMIKQNPFGYGLGTYRYESARSGLTPQTQFAHQGFLQIGVEAGVVGLLAWLGFAGAWFWTVLRGSRKVASDRAMLLASVLAAVIGSAAHNCFDSDWQHFGIGLTFFVLLGLGLQLSGDGSMPEMVPKRARVYGLLGGCAFLSLALLASASSEFLKASGLSAAQAGDMNGALGAIESAIKLSPSDGEAYRMLAQYKPDARLENLQRAAQLAPNTKNLRALARAQAAAGNFVEATASLKRALERDPNNLPALLLLVQLSDQQGDHDQTRKWGERLLDVESGPYFKVRALPLVVPTETYEGRAILAKITGDPQEAIKLETDAVKGLADYAKTTVPQIVAQVKAGGTDYAGETAQDAIEKLKLGRDLCDDLRARLQRSGASTAEVDALATVLAEPAFPGAFGGP